ncbi:MAG: DUF192 domain-containing protein [Candidatus Omnitrophica bacterium]|nr:DUF192 domain-containing protein [Candidatus Omnitrophota bacterium]MBU4477520.1 DUF192 domain-containing protein [Candidatus Omnitrophota bacterium]
MAVKKRWAVFGVVLCAGLMLVYALPLRPMLLNGKFMVIETARTPQQRSRGLQGRSYLDKQRGMLFVFPEEAMPQFWMKDTFIPLEIAFIDKQKRIVDIQEMIPLRTDMIYSPSKKVCYALEMNSGWFKANNVKVGDRIFFW